MLAGGTKKKHHDDGDGDGDGSGGGGIWPQSSGGGSNGGVFGRVDPIPRSAAASAASAAASACLPTAKAATGDELDRLDRRNRRDSMRGLLSKDDDEDARSEASTLPPAHGE